MQALPLVAARGAFGGLLGQVFAKPWFKTFSEAQIPSLISCATYATTYFGIKTLTGNHFGEKEKKLLIHVISFGVAFYLTEKIYQAFFNQKFLFNKELTHTQSAAFALGSTVSFFLVGD
jgi:hypothetical protein